MSDLRGTRGLRPRFTALTLRPAVIKPSLCVLNHRQTQSPQIIVPGTAPWHLGHHGPARHHGRSATGNPHSRSNPSRPREPAACRHRPLGFPPVGGRATGDCARSGRSRRTGLAAAVVALESDCPLRVSLTHSMTCRIGSGTGDRRRIWLAMRTGAVPDQAVCRLQPLVVADLLREAEEMVVSGESRY